MTKEYFMGRVIAARRRQIRSTCALQGNHPANCSTAEEPLNKRHHHLSQLLEKEPEKERNDGSGEIKIASLLVLTRPRETIAQAQPSKPQLTDSKPESSSSKPT
ncbi:hypothetical protein TNCT_663361 [Trichonephila clavata]|uniref:Uncharacterized protein n=1 Tax=Trichonephila clavata TaxID=2740835 RepID=A0A8X6FNX5_TRICU|nr:hypothetical protein TNCT_663361 [Trichonephila clavata]